MRSPVDYMTSFTITFNKYIDTEYHFGKNIIHNYNAIRKHIESIRSNRPSVEENKHIQKKQKAKKKYINP